MAANNQKLKHALESLVGVRCIHCLWGKGTGSVVKFGFTINDSLQTEKRAQRSILRNELMVYCAWRLVSNSFGIFSWRDIGIRDQELIKAFDSVSGQSIVELNYDAQSHDFNFQFEDNSVFSIFCDIASDDESDENYILFSSSEILYIDYQGNIQTEAYAV